MKVDSDVVRKIALALPDVEETTARGVLSFKAHGKLVVWTPTHKTAEANSLAVRIGFDQRAELIATEPGIYYVPDHYVNYPTVLVRLSRIHRDSLRDLLGMAWQFVGTGASRGGAKVRKLTAIVNQRQKLSASMTLNQFENGYWYVTQLKNFAETIGIPSASKLRKDELERAIRSFLETGKVKNPTQRSLSNSGIKDVERGLSLERDVVRYTNDEETKSFLEREAQKRVPGLKRKSGVRYRLNRWREQQLVDGVKLTYGDLVKEYVRLNQTEGSFAQIPHGRYINFISDFLAAEKGATREQAIRAWEKLKSLNVPKNYRAWVRVRVRLSKSR
jgi:hypothetical protein